MVPLIASAATMTTLGACPNRHRTYRCGAPSPCVATLPLVLLAVVSWMRAGAAARVAPPSLPRGARPAQPGGAVDASASPSSSAAAGKTAMPLAEAGARPGDDGDTLVRAASRRRRLLPARCRLQRSHTNDARHRDRGRHHPPGAGSSRRISAAPAPLPPSWAC